jgi:fatty acid desaturase
MNQPHTLPPALLGDKKHLSDQARTEILKLNGAKPVAFLLQAFGAWAVIISAIALAVYIDSIWASILAIVIIATRLNILALLVHDQVHSLGFRGQYGDLIVNLLAAFPLGITVAGYAQVHLSHHKYFFTEKDPDHLRKSGVDWAFPMSKARLTKILLSDILGLSFVKLLKGKRLKNEDVFKRSNPSPEWARPAFYLLLAALITYMGAWHIFLIYWILPFTTIFSVIVRLGAITEHVYNLHGASVVESSPIILLRWWEKLLLPNLNFTLHPYHHFFPGVAYCNLPKIHKIYQQEKLVNNSNIFYGYLAYLKFLQSPQNGN